MSKEQIALRLLSAESGINPRPLQSGFVDETDWSKIAQVMNLMHAAPMWIDDSPVLTVMELRTKARRLEAEQHGLDLLIVDYLQLMQGNLSQREPNRVQEVSEISRGLKQLSRELKVPVIALSQLSRGVEQRGSAEPRLSDLRESGSIEQDADVVIFLYRAEGEVNAESDVELIKAKVAKHRNGPIGEIALQFRKTNTRFYTMATREDAVAPTY
jgi:replicative DNA helicase